MKLFAVCPVSGKRLPAVIEGREIVALCGPVATSALILIDGGDYYFDDVVATAKRLRSLGYRNVQAMRWKVVQAK